MAEDPRLRALPSVSELLDRPAVRALAARVGRAAALRAVRSAVDEVRDQLRTGRAGPAPEGALVSDEAIAAAAQRLLAPRLRRVINATGVVLHTNLGRAPLHAEVAARVAEIAAGYSNLELDLATGRRGARHALVEPMLCELFSAEAAHVTTNCAGATATLLALAALGAGGAAVVSRGELVEIGGGFRVPEILSQSGCRLVEVGTTNRTHLRDYETALDRLAAEKAAPVIVLRVHRSNFALVGFQAQPSLAELAGLAHARSLPLLYDLGSGAVSSPAAPGLPAEPTARHALQEGADLVMASGDKLLGGPQAGLLLGRRALVELCRKHPLARALRADKLLLAALEATLDLYRRGRGAELPALAALGATPESLRQKATRLALLLGERGAPARVVECAGRVGGGSLPQARLASWGVAVDSPAPAALLAALRAGARDRAPAVGLLREDALVLDVRCVQDEELVQLAASVAGALDALARSPTEAQEGPQPQDAFGPEGATLED
jgi:L-seryl-tRNA(Ser) seleniumtransferase